MVSLAQEEAQVKADDDQEPLKTDDSLVSMSSSDMLDEQSGLCDTMDLGDPFEDYDNPALKYDYGDKNAHRVCIKKHDNETAELDAKHFIQL